MSTSSNEHSSDGSADADASCYSCAREAENRAGRTLPDRELIVADEHWRVAHATHAALPGWLVLMPRRHVMELADLTDEESEALGRWQVRLARGFRSALGVDKTYVAEFGEAAGFHLHFHVVPRGADLEPQWCGPKVFGLLGRTQESGEIPEPKRDELARRLRGYL